MQNLETKFGQLLKQLRAESGLTQEDLAIQSDLDRTYISLLERGLRQPTISTLFKIAEVLEVTPSSIIKKLEE
ncbi:MAG TPA: helix-turn-helix transcriptional regulator [Ohtaekwangia sp.]|uniref:helix-turn-helix domain-containing protein n=1 Tax=Ohtaekwangia sp. TaxID=2066019 RepID=UPI002F92389C